MAARAYGDALRMPGQLAVCGGYNSAQCRPNSANADHGHGLRVLRYLLGEIGKIRAMVEGAKIVRKELGR